MKKIVLIVSMLFGLAGISMAQTAPAKDTKKAKTTTAAKTATTAPKTPTTTATPATGAVHTKKDGTPDMRYKENKEAAKAHTEHLKKDGTPDKRYKENKDKKGDDDKKDKKPKKTS